MGATPQHKTQAIWPVERPEASAYIVINGA
jgi:hypothetical protein